MKKQIHTKILITAILGVGLLACGDNSHSNPTDSSSMQAALLDLSKSGPVVITSVNGIYDSNHAASINVHPGDVITFSADLLDESNAYQPLNANVEQFIWSADDSANDSCDANNAQDCYPATSFQVNNYGVAFYVPSSVGAEVTLTVRDRNDSTHYDSIQLINVDFQADGGNPPSTIITDPAQYDHATLDSNYALAGQGHWVYINGLRYWSPSTYATDDTEEWTPYQNGYWNSDASNNMIWNSYDPWGWYTDHYGYWRQHETYGWIWSAFEGSDFRYHNHCVSWFDDGHGYIGWYPYYSGASHGYHDGAERGFNDGYWLGYRVGDGYGTAGYGYHPGFTIVEYSRFNHENIAGVYQHSMLNHAFNPTVVLVLNQARSGNTFGADPRTTIRGQLAVLPRTTLISAGRNNVVRVAQPSHQTPAQYTQIATTLRQTRSVPIGTAIDARQSTVGGRPTVVHPTLNGRGVVAAPVGHDSTGHIASMPAQTARPVQINPSHPTMNTRPAVKPPVTPPTTRPVLPRPVPPVHTTPAPRPAPVPAPRVTPAPRPVPRPLPRPPVPRPSPPTPRATPHSVD